MIFKKERDKIHSNRLSGVLYGKWFHLYCSKGIIFIMERVFIAAKRYCQLSGCDLTISEVKVICYERMVSNDLHSKDRKGNLRRPRHPRADGWAPRELSLQWRMRSPGNFQDRNPINLTLYIKKKTNTKVT